MRIADVLSGVPLLDRQDAICLLTSILKRPRSFVYTDPNYALSPLEGKVWQGLWGRYQQGEPLAYLMGTQDFHALCLDVNTSVLIPRVETEQMVEWILDQFCDASNFKAADLGTGSGAIACALALARPQWEVCATDLSVDALRVAQQNAARYQLNIHFYQGAWCAPLSLKDFDLIVSNPPYIALDDPELDISVTQYEPRSALIAEDSGFRDLYAISESARRYLKPHGILVMEHGHRQGKSMVRHLQALGYQEVCDHLDGFGRSRFVSAKHWP